MLYVQSIGNYGLQNKLKKTRPSELMVFLGSYYYQITMNQTDGIKPATAGTLEAGKFYLHKHGAWTRQIIDLSKEDVYYIDGIGGVKQCSRAHFARTCPCEIDSALVQHDFSTTSYPTPIVIY